MKTILHKAATRGNANHGWLESWHTFSFGSYHQNDRMHFGALRVLNDDTVAPAMGFGSHPHDNMEIVSIPLAGDLEHKDNTGTKAVIKKGDVQIMSAGTGIVHSEKNASNTEGVKFLQIWIFPNKKNIAPRYDQKSFTDEEKNNAGFELQRSSDGIDYYTIAQVEPKGGRRKEYSYNDYYDGKQSITYYKLVQRDFNGDKTSFPVVAIGVLEVNRVSLVFDQGDKTIYASFSQPVDQDSELIIYNITGQIVAREKIQKGAYQKVIPASGFASGIYSYSVSGSFGMKGKIAVYQLW